MESPKSSENQYEKISQQANSSGQTNQTQADVEGGHGGEETGGLRTNPFLIDDILHKHRHKSKQLLTPQGSKVNVRL